LLGPGSATFFFSKPGALLEPEQQNVFTLNSSTPWRNSAATETRRGMSLRTVIEIDDPALSRRVNRVDVRTIKRQKVESIRTYK
jgi:hypothetical protein